jgi:muramoyltetrapeptide carboxypeptidase
MILTPKLVAGDAVGIVAPARKVSPEQITPATDVLRGWGLEPVLAPGLFSEQHSYLAGTDDERRSDLQRFLDDTSIKAIFCARGGYGSTRILDDLDFTALRHHPKWIIGFSDITAIHLALARIGIASAHATMPLFFGQAEAQNSVESLRQLLFGGRVEISAPARPGNRAGVASGRVLGGNLSLVVDAIGTASDPDTTDAILIIEEIDEYYYKVDRMFRQLRRSGKLSRLAGLVVGHMTDMKNSDLAFAESIQEIVTDALHGCEFPVAFGFPSGHENPNLAWMHGAKGILEVGDKGARLCYPTSAEV